jgi:hypothetical protein
MSKNREITPVEIFAGTIMEAEMLKSFLENSDIDAYLKDANTGSIAPWYTGGLGSVKVIVSSVDFEQAIIVVEEYQKNLDSDNSDSF